MKPILSAVVCLRHTQLSSEEARFLRKYNPAGLTLFKRNIQTPEQVKKLTDDIRSAVGRDDFLIAIDQEGGAVRRLRPPYWFDYVSQEQLGRLPVLKARKAIKLHAALIAHDLHSLGINVNFAPVADTLHPDTTGAIASRCFSQRPNIVSKYTSLLAKTYMEQGICPCMKHLPGHGLAQSDSHLGLPVIEAKMSAIRRDLEPFQKMAPFIPMGMTAHVVLSQIDGYPITQSSKGIDFIRQEIGFDGLLITDAIEMRALKGTLSQKTELSLAAGCDLVCYCSGHNQNNPQIIDENIQVLQASRPLTDQALERLERVKKVFQSHPPMQKVELLKAEYQKLVANVADPKQNGPDTLTENWGDKENFH